MKTVKFLMLLGFCTMVAGFTTGVAAVWVIGIISCVVLFCIFSYLLNKERTRNKNISQMSARLNAQMTARQHITDEMLKQEFSELVTEMSLPLIMSGMNNAEIPELAANRAGDVLMEKYGYTASELGSILSKR